MTHSMTAARPGAAGAAALVTLCTGATCTDEACDTGTQAMEPPDLDVLAIVSQVEHAIYEGNQALRHVMLARSRHLQDDLLRAAEEEFKLEMKAAKDAFAAGITGAIGDIAGGAVQVGGAGMALKQLRASAAQARESTTASEDAARLRNALGETRAQASHDRRSLRKLSDDLKSNTVKLGNAKAELDRANSRHDRSRFLRDFDRHFPEANAPLLRVRQGMNRQEVERARSHVDELKKHRDATSRRITATKQSIGHSESRQAVLGTKLDQAKTRASSTSALAERHLRLAQVSTQMGTGVGEAVSGLVKLGAAMHNRDAGEASARAKLAHAHVDLANLGYQQALDLANAARDALNETRGMQSASSQSTQQTYASVARNMA